MFKSFKNEIFDEAGFYILKYKEGHKEKVYSEQPEAHYFNGVYKFWCTYENNKYTTKHDLGMCNWINSCNIYGPSEWRKMNKQEEKLFKSKLYRFDRKKE